jgi:hypothetical protein
VSADDPALAAYRSTLTLTGGSSWRRPAGDVATFRQAAVTLSALPEQQATHSAPAAMAGEALRTLAEKGDERALSDILRPDPRPGAVTWTVACYQLGDMTPSELVDLPSAVAAVRCLAGCGNPSHVAAELLASTRQGLRWTAMVRTGERLSFQLLSTASGSDQSAGEPGGLAGSIALWKTRLEAWERNPYDGLDRSVPPSGLEPAAVGDGGGGPAEGLISIPVAEALTALHAGVEALRTALGDATRRLERIETLLDEIRSGAMSSRGSTTPSH